VHLFHTQNTLVACRSFLQRYSFLLTKTRKYNFNNLSNSLRNKCCRKQLDFIRFFIKMSCSINHGCSTTAPRTNPFEALPSPTRIKLLGPYHHYPLRAVGACRTIPSQAIKGMRAWTIIHYIHYYSLHHPSSLKSLTLYLVNFVYLNVNKLFTTTKHC
jgi:hypothetical protein